MNHKLRSLRKLAFVTKDFCQAFFQTVLHADADKNGIAAFTKKMLEGKKKKPHGDNWKSLQKGAAKKSERTINITSDIFAVLRYLSNLCDY
jgi:hypothetical protein